MEQSKNYTQLEHSTSVPAQNEEQVKSKDVTVTDSNSEVRPYAAVSAIISESLMPQITTHEKFTFIEALILECQVQVSVQMLQDGIQISGSLLAIIVVYLRLTKVCGDKVFNIAVAELHKLLPCASHEREEEKPVITQSGRVVKRSRNYINYIKSRADSDRSDQDDDESESLAEPQPIKRAMTKSVVCRRQKAKKYPNQTMDELEGFNAEVSRSHKTVDTDEKNWQEATRRADDALSCDKCSYRATRMIHIEKHKLLHLKTTKLYKCHKCAFTALSSGHLQRHEVTHATKVLTCNSCKYKTDSSQRLRRHYHLKHSNAIAKVAVTREMETCPQCSYATKSKGLMERHMTKHTPLVGYDCPLCDYKTSHRHHMKRHVTIVHSETRPFLCDYCGKAFKRKDSLEQHKANHGDKSTRPILQCSHCPRTFFSKSSLHEHLTMHSSQRSFLCDHCGAAFKTRAVQRKHIRTIHVNPNSYKCTHCPKHFSTSYAFKRHVSIHKDDAPQGPQTSHNPRVTSQLIYLNSTSQDPQLVKIPDSLMTQLPYQQHSKVDESSHFPVSAVVDNPSLPEAPFDQRELNRNRGNVDSSTELAQLPTITLHIQSVPAQDGSLYIPTLNDASSRLSDSQAIPIVIPNSESPLSNAVFSPSSSNAEQKEQLSQLQNKQDLQMQKEQKVPMSQLHKEFLMQLQKEQLSQLHSEQLSQLHKEQQKEQNQHQLVQMLNEQISNSLTLDQLSTNQLTEFTNHLTSDQLAQLSNGIVAITQVPINLTDINSLILGPAVTLNQIPPKAPNDITSVPLSAIQTSLLTNVGTPQDVEPTNSGLQTNDDTSLNEINIDSMLDRSADNQTLRLYLPDNFQQM